MFSFTFSIAEDGKTASVTFPSTAHLTANDVEEFIVALANIRTNLAPEVPRAPDLLKPVQSQEDPRFWVTWSQMSGDTMLGVRHPGLGWLWNKLPAASKAQLLELLNRDAPEHVGTGSPKN